MPYLRCVRLSMQAPNIVCDSIQIPLFVNIYNIMDPPRHAGRTIAPVPVMTSDLLTSWRQSAFVSAADPLQPDRMRRVAHCHNYSYLSQTDSSSVHDDLRSLETPKDDKSQVPKSQNRLHHMQVSPDLSVHDRPVQRVEPTNIDRRRHVKCGEEKPGCARCIKWRGHCSGYENLISQTSLTSGATEGSSTRNLDTQDPMKHRIPAISRASSNRRSSARGASAIQAQTPNLASSPSSDQNIPPRTRNSVFGPDFWKTTVPQLVEENAAVRSANMAVHTLIRAKQPSLMSLEPLQSDDDYYGGALRCYGMALSQVRQTSVTPVDIRSAILCSMFFVIFEIINGDQAAAEAHLFSGQRMMDELPRAEQGMKAAGSPSSGSGASSQSSGKLRSELSHVLQFLALQARSDGVQHWVQEVGGRKNHEVKTESRVEAEHSLELSELDLDDIGDFNFDDI